MSYTYDYPRLAVTVDAVIIDNFAKPAEVLLIQRANDPYQGQWALPGGFVDMDEPIKDAALRELREETGVILKDVEFVGYYDAVGRDPRQRSLSLAFVGLTSTSEHDIVGNDDAADAKWFAVTNLPELAFDHQRIVADAIAKL